MMSRRGAIWAILLAFAILVVSRVEIAFASTMTSALWPEPAAEQVPPNSVDLSSLAEAKGGLRFADATIGPITRVGSPTNSVTPTITLKPEFTRTVVRPTLPFDIDSLGASASDFAQQLRLAFLLGIQATAGLFVIIGIVAFLRHTL